MDKNFGKRIEEKENRELRAEWMQASASGTSAGDLETDDSVVTRQVAPVRASDLETDD